jgi:hypothetical protein
MSTQTDITVKSSDNPALINSMVAQALANDKTEVKPVTIMPPSDTVVTLPGGYITFAGEVVKEVEVRELNGKDEEAIARSTSVGKALLLILNRGVVRIGEEKATDAMIDSLLAGDRDFLMIAIYKATFGDEAILQGICGECNQIKDVNIHLDTDIKVRPMANALERKFTVDCKVGPVEISLPTGHTQKDLVNNSDKTVAELTTILLENCVDTIDGSDVLGKAQVQNLGLNDRKAIAEEINKRNFGPLFDNVAVTCPDCESEVLVPINLGTLFRI